MKNPRRGNPWWSCRWESNPRPVAYKATALASELRQHMAEGEGFEPPAVILRLFSKQVN